MSQREHAERRSRYESAVETLNSFSADLHGRVAAASDGNFFLSPFSIHAALSLAFAGASGETARQMAATLHVPAEGPRVSAASQVLSEIFSCDYPVGELAIANALWAQSGLPLQPKFAEEHADVLQHVDFAGSPEKARRRVNAWVAERTANRIREIVDAGSLNELTRLIVTNAVYFRADWREKFEPRRTVDRPFHLEGGEIVQVTTMQQKEDFRVVEHQRFSAIELWYEGFAMSMLLFVPRQASDLPWLAKTALATSPRQWQDRMERRKVDLALPRFRFESSFAVDPILASMGMARAFDPQGAEFGGITSAPFWLSDVTHKTFVDVNEEGTEAAGLTSMMLCGGVGAQHEPFVLKVDRPFVFTICGHSPGGGGGVILFVGQVGDPRR